MSDSAASRSARFWVGPLSLRPQLFFALGLLLTWWPAQARASSFVQDTVPLEPGKPIERELAGGQNHVYQITVSTEQYLQVVVDQRGIEVVVSLFGQNGTKLIEVDSPKGTEGTKSLKYITEGAVSFRLEIRSLAKEAKAGRYEVKIVGLQVTTEADQALAEASSLYSKAVSLFLKGKPGSDLPLAEAIPLVERVLTLREKALGPDHPIVSIPLNFLATSYRIKGDYVKAEPLLQRALSIREKALGPDHPQVIASISNFASLYRDMGNYAKAESLVQRVLSFWEKASGPDHPAVTGTLASLATLYRDKGDHIKAEPLLLRSLAIWEKALGPDTLEVSIRLTSLASLYRLKGDYEKAEPLFQRSLTIQEKLFGPNTQPVASALSDLADLYRDKGDYAKAEPLLQRSLAIWEKASGPNHTAVAVSLTKLAELYHNKGDYAKAEPLLDRALAIFEKARGSDYPRGAAASFNHLASLYHDKGDYGKAEALYQRALVLRQEAFGPNHPEVALSLNNLAALYRDQGKPQQAIAFAARAAEVSEYSLNQTLVTGSERQKLLFLALREDETNRIVSLHAQSAPHDPQALKLALTTLLRRKGRGLEAVSNVIDTLRRHTSPDDQALFDRLISTRSQLATLTLRGPERASPDQFRSQLKHLEDEADKLEADLSARSAEFRTQTQPVTLAAIQAALPKDAALVEFATYRFYEAKTKKDGPVHYIAYLLAAQDEPRWVALGEAAPIDRAVAELRRALRDPQRADVKRLARAVDEKVMQPVRALLGETRRVLISPDGALNLIPFAALVDEHNRYLVQHYTFSYLTSGRDLLSLQVKQPSKQRAMVVADPDFGDEAVAGKARERILKYRPAASSASDSGVTSGSGSVLADAYFPPLPGTAEEARALRALLPDATVLTRAQATEAKLKQANGPRLLHVATHGFFLEGQQATIDDTRILKPSSGSVMADAPSSQRIENPLLRSGLALAGANRLIAICR